MGAGVQSEAVAGPAGSGTFLSGCRLQVLKVAILAEKYAVDYTWYVDTILNLIRIAGDYVSEEVWYRVIQIVINRDDVQGYAAKTVFEVQPACPSSGVVLGAWLTTLLPPGTVPGGSSSSSAATSAWLSACH